MQRALEKRPVSVERLEEAIAQIKQKLRATGEREVKSLVVGELVMNELRRLDEVAYIRFASVYRRFQGPQRVPRRDRAPVAGAPRMSALSDPAYMARALELARQGCTPPIPIRASAPDRP